MSTDKHILILGGGFAGIGAANELLRLGKGDSSFQVHLVSNENYFVFQPLLPEVVACGIEPTHISVPIRQLCQGVQFHCATIMGMDPSTQQVSLVGVDTRQPFTLHYDHLLICLGMTVDFSHLPGLAEHSLPMKTLGDALHLRNHVISCLEEAELANDEATRKKLLTFITIGGGFSGVETAAAINDMIYSVLKFYPRVQSTGHRMVLVHSGQRIFGELNPKLADFASLKLQRRKIEIYVKTRVTEVSADGVLLSDGNFFQTGTVICTVGNTPHSCVKQSGLPQERGRLLVDENLHVHGHSNIWAFGDAALVPDVVGKGFCPPTAQYASRQGIHCAKNIFGMLQGKSVQPFRHGNLGQMAVVGRHSAVVQVFGWNFSGFLAWCFWRLVYFAKLPGFRTKVRVGIDWVLDLIFSRDIAKIDVHRTELLKRAHFRKGEVIIRQGEIGDRFYFIESGEVEIIGERDGLEQRLGIRSTGDSFGEIALLQDVRRKATVRCLTSVDVVCLKRGDFRVLVDSFPQFRSHLEGTTKSIMEPSDS